MSDIGTFERDDKEHRKRRRLTQHVRHPARYQITVQATCSHDVRKEEIMGIESATLFEGQLTTTEALAYTAPHGQQVKVTDVQLVNITAGTVTARIDRVPSGGTDATTEEIFNESIAANSTVSLPGADEDGVVDLQPGDQLFVSSGTAAAIDITLSGDSQPI
jgi:hypothetical protein